MRTRRSPRNQDRLFADLFRPSAEPQPPRPPPASHCWDCRHYPKGGRDSAKCRLTGKRTGGHEERNCYEMRPMTLAQLARKMGISRPANKEE